MTTLVVCTGMSCTPQGGRDLLRDIEDLCNGKGMASINCVDKCGQGPNAGLKDKTGKLKETFEGIDTFKKVEGLAKKAGAKYSSTQKAVAEAAFQYRREKAASKKSAILKGAFGKLGDEKAAASREPRALATLLVLRSSEHSAAKASAEALKDAQQALKLVPNWGTGYLTLAKAHESAGNMKEASQAIMDMEDTNDTYDTREAGQVEKRIKDVEKKAEEEKKKLEEEAQAAEEEERRIKEEAEKKKKEEAELKRKKELLAKKKAQEAAAAKKKAEEQAKAKEEAERKAKEEAEEFERKAKEEEERLKAEEEARAAAEEEARIKAEEEEKARLKAEAEAKAKAEEEERLRAEAEEAARVKAAKEAKEEAIRKAAEERAKLGVFACCFAPAKPLPASDLEG
eukprot:TRINITY_DN22156_c0_g3_i1.p1 TRINITY_DN22156_c0_g3~~TRINITY_DN22156_c0_g3_i1.p1  ORF type:complete len:399 (-),score=208.99 TRINITY_DN22156_c0_g3_i1:227-1423(-)